MSDSMSETERARVCVPVCVRRADELRPSFEQAAGLADIVELRLDCLDRGQLAVALQRLTELLAGAPGQRFIITYRPRGQGGGCDLSLEERLGFWLELPGRLRGAAGRERAFADVELDLLESPRSDSLDGLFRNFTVICSHHDIQETPDDLSNIFGRKARTPADVLKMAARANSITDCVEVVGLCERARREGRECIAVSMGEAGLLTRVLAPAFGAYLTYGSLDAAQATAPGQVEARALQEMIRAHAVERVEMPALIRHRDERALVAREQRECAHRCAGTVIVESRSLRYALTRLGGRLLLLLGRLGEAEGQRVDCAQYAQASPG